MRGKLTLLAGVCAGALAFPAYAQDAAVAEEDAAPETEIIVTAQRTSQRLQDVPIAVSAFSAEALDKQQIKTTSDLQLTLPNITFTKTNFTSSSFTIRGIGDLCVGTTCDSATAIHLNDAPLFSTRLFEGEFYDLAQIEVLRGPQGTLFGKNATSGVVNFRTARPRMGDFNASAEAEYGNYDHVKVKGMVNVPLGEAAAVRVAGYYLRRDGYTTNLTDGKRYDNRDMYGLRGSLRFEPSESTKIDLMVQYFHERDNRMRIQKQMCQRDPTGVLGCLNADRRFELVNANATLFFAGATSRQFFAVQGLPVGLPGPLPVNLSLNDLLNPVDAFANSANPADVRKVTTAFTPSYFTDELIAQADLEQELGNGLTLKLGGNYQKVNLDSQQGTLGIAARPNLAMVAAGAAGGFGAAAVPYFSPIASALIPNGPAGMLCTSAAEPTGTGVYGGHKNCANTPQVNDRSIQNNSSWSAEAIISSDWDGMFNFLLGGIYGKYHLTENSYYGTSFALDYFSGVAGGLKAFTNTAADGVTPAPLPPSFLASPFFRNNTDDLKIRSYGIFGEGYFKFNDQIKLTLGLRYNNDRKDVRARSTLFGWLTPHGTAESTTSPFIAAYDADPGIAGNQLFQLRNGQFSAWTGRAVLDYAITPDNLVYASYSRGYKSGGINPPLSPVFSVAERFKPEFVNAFEIGSKNTFGDVQLNLTGFYYKYKDLQLSRIVARTAVNDNVSANIWGLEAEAILRPTPGLTINANASYLKTKISEDKFLSNPRDFGGGRADAVIIKDITNYSNCAVSSNSGSVAGVNAFVGIVNGIINNGIDANADGDYKDTGEVSPGAGLATTTSSFGAGSGIASTGAHSVCAVLQAAAAGAFIGAGLNPATFGGITFGTPASNSPGIDVNIKGNKLPGAPDYKFSMGMQYAAPIGEMTLTPRVDFIYTGKSSGNIFGGAVNAIPSYTQVNAQLQLDGKDDRWFMRAYVQNLFDKDSITGLHLTDASQGLATNIFTLEPRRFGIAAGVKF